MKLAIVGANGFIGGRAVEMFHLLGWAEVVPVVRQVAGLARAARFGLNGRIADARDEAALRAAFSGCDVVLHAVAGSPETILGTLTPVYRAAEAAGVRRLIYLSTASVHGQAPAPGTDETSPLDDAQPIAYNNAKVAAERQLQTLRRSGSVELVLLRPGIVWGPRSYWISSFVEDLANGNAYVVDGAVGICNSIYVDNLVQAVRLAATAADADGHAFLLGDAETVTWADLYRPLVQAMGTSWADVPSLPAPPLPQTTGTDRVRAIHQSRPVQAFLALFPYKLRLAAFQALMAFRDEPYEAPDPWQRPLSPRPSATLEMAMLHRCETRLPQAKAAQMLGYAPLVSFAEGMGRTIGWLDFAGYRPVDCHPPALAAWEARHG